MAVLLTVISHIKVPCDTLPLRSFPSFGTGGLSLVSVILYIKVLGVCNGNLWEAQHYYSMCGNVLHESYHYMGVRGSEAKHSEQLGRVREYAICCFSSNEIHSWAQLPLIR